MSGLRTSVGDLSYGLASQEDGPICNDLNNGFFKRNRTLAQWQWEFCPPHLPFDRLPYAVARDGERIVGTQGIIVLPMLSERGPFWTAKGEDTIVHPRYWGRDALTEMYKVLFAFCERNGIPLAWGFNNREGAFSRAGFQYFPDGIGGVELFRALNRRAVDVVLQSTTKLKKRFERRGGEIAKIAVSLAAVAWADCRALGARIVRVVTGRARGLTVTELQGPAGEEFDALAHRFIRRYGGITLHRTGAFVTWRLLNNPFAPSTIVMAHWRGELCGYMAFAQTVDRQAYVSDYFVCPPHGKGDLDKAILGSLFDAIVSRARARGASVLRATSYNSHTADLSFRRVARDVGFLGRATQVGACYRLFPEAENVPDAANYGKWFVTSMNTEGRTG